MRSLKTQLQPLASRKPHEAKQAAQALEAAPPKEATAALLELCEHNRQDRKRLLAIATWSIISCGSLWLLFKIGIIVSEAHLNPSYLFGLALFLLPACIIPAIRNAREPRWKKAAMTLLDYDDSRILVPLLELTAISTSDELAKSPRLLNEISRRLWHLMPGDIHAFDKDSRTAILGIVELFYPPQWPQKRAAMPKMTDEMCDVVVAALRAVAILGDAKARKIVGQIANVPAKTSNERCVQEVAQECLVLLDARVAEKADIQKRLAILLRGVKSLDVGMAQLKPFLETLTSEQAKIALVVLLGNQCATRKRNFWIQQGVFGVSVASAYFVMQWMTVPSGLQVYVYIVLNFLCNILGNRFHSVLPSDKAAAIALSQYDDVHLLGRLLDAHDDSPKVYQIEDALKKLLPQLQSGDGYLLGPRQRAQLRYIVHYSKHWGNPDGFPPYLTAATLDALRVVGDTKAVKVARLALRKHKDARVREAAERLIAEHDAARKTGRAQVGTMTP